MQTFEYVVEYKPRLRDERGKVGEVDRANALILLGPAAIFCASEHEASMRIAREVPMEYQDKLQDVEIRIRPFG